MRVETASPVTVADPEESEAPDEPDESDPDELEPLDEPESLDDPEPDDPVDPLDPDPHPDGRWARIHGRWRKLVGVRYETALEKRTPLHPLHDCPARQGVPS